MPQDTVAGVKEGPISKSKVRYERKFGNLALGESRYESYMEGGMIKNRLKKEVANG